MVRIACILGRLKLSMKSLLLLFVMGTYFCNIPVALSRKSTFNAGGAYEKVFMPVMSSNSIIIDDDDLPPNEPNLSKTKFLKYPPIFSLGERVERLIYGIKIDVKPELDHYGYEIRRYMAHVGNIHIYDDNEFLNEQMINVKKSRVIVNFWKKHLEKEINEMEAIIDNDSSVELRVRTTFKQNKFTVQTFLNILSSWIDSNERLLQAVKKEPNIYGVRYPELEIVIPASRVNFFNLYSKRQAKLKDLRKYNTFAMMVY